MMLTGVGIRTGKPRRIVGGEGLRRRRGGVRGPDDVGLARVPGFKGGRAVSLQSRNWGHMGPIRIDGEKSRRRIVLTSERRRAGHERRLGFRGRLRGKKSVLRRGKDSGEFKGEDPGISGTVGERKFPAVSPVNSARSSAEERKERGGDSADAWARNVSG